MLTSDSLYQLFARTARSYPHELAISADVSLTYQQLEAAVAALHQTICREAADEEILGVPTTRGPAQIISLLAILKAGKAYLPLDLTYPAARLRHMVENARLRTCLTTPADAAAVAAIDLRPLLTAAPPAATAQPAEPRPGSAAYVLYTSGSTGAPKGVCMGPAALLNLLTWQNQHSRAGAGTRTLQFAPLSFDVSFQEILTTLSTGGTLVLITEELRLDMDALLTLLTAQRVNRLFLPFVALQALAEAAVSAGRFPTDLREIMTAGEQLKITPQLAQFFGALPDCTLANQYGPTECHVVSELRLVGPPASWPALPTIGQPIANTTIYILDEQQRPLPAGEAGELCIGGAGLADGYLGRPELTAEKFISWQAADNETIRLYRTGDVARYLPDGNVEFLGRRDDQVKIRGHRVELGEVEVALTGLPGIRQAVVLASNHLAGQTQLVAYLQAVGGQPDTALLRQQAAAVLPDYLRPAVYVWVADFPRTSSGKIDKKALPRPEYVRPESAPLFKKPTTPTEKNLAAVWGELLQIPAIGADDNFFELGGTSLLAQKAVAALRQRHAYALPITKLYQFPTVAGLAAYLADARPAPASATENVDSQPAAAAGAVAVIGMAGRFPGADSVAALWDVLRQGQETIRFFTPDELDATIPAALRDDPLYVRARGVLPGATQFDAAFFGLSPRMAEAMDPQQRVFLEIAWEALEQAGHLPRHYNGRVGVFAGSGNNSYYQHNVLPNAPLLAQVGAFQAMTVNEKDYLASRTAYQLNLTGPAVSVYSACSTSLLAIAQAVQSIRSGQCAVALAGGASITAPLHSGHLYQEGAMLSPDGHCRPFDAAAQGTVFSDGAGVVVLKRLEDAQQAGDVIYAIIKGVGVNNDGGGKGSFTAPSAVGQAGAIRQALRDAQVAPATIGYVEAHGTATPLGDPIEVEGLRLAFGEQTTTGFCALGSLKSNLGHLTAAAGVAGFIKTVLALHHRQLPPSLGYQRPNPAIDFPNSPFFVNTVLRPWLADGPRRAGVSSFGVGGTNVHVVLEEGAPVAAPAAPVRPWQLLAWSAKTLPSRAAYAALLARHLEQTPALPLAETAYSLHTTKVDFAHRRFVVAATPAGAAEALLRPDATATEAATVRAAPGEVVFLFPGQGAQYLQMGRALYAHEAAYRQAVDECAALLQPYLGADIRQVLYPDAELAAAAERLRDTRYTQPALFVTEYALARLWLSWGVAPTALCGHSIGEFVAAHLAGVFTLPDALRLVATRGRLVGELPRGRMLSVRMPADQLAEILPAGLSVAAVNTQQLCVVAGPDEDVAAFARWADERRILNRPLATSHAFHSTMMDPVLAEFGAVVAQVALHRPRLPLVSTVSGTWLTDAEATDPQYWTQHLRRTVRFADALETLFQQDAPLLLEVGPGRTATTLARQQAAGRPLTALASLPEPQNDDGPYPALLDALGRLWLHGLAPDWPAFYADHPRQKVWLPAYAFDRQRCWAEPPAPVPPPLLAPAPAETLPGEASSAEKPPKNSSKPMRTNVLLQKIAEIVTNASGLELAAAAADRSFLELGLDSLILTQVALTCKKEFSLSITFRQLNEELSSPALLAAYLDRTLPADRYAPAPAPVVAAVPAGLVTPAASAPALPATAVASGPDSALGLMAQQLQLLGRQLALLQGGPAEQVASVSPAAAVPAAAPVPAPAPTSPAAVLTPEEVAEHRKPFGAAARIERQAAALPAGQQRFLEQLTRRYNQQTAGSKAYAQQHRARMADPRVVSGFKPLTKELVYPLVVEKSAGSRLWDVDGNEYLDALNGFGSTLFGHQPDFIKDALHQQIERGYEVGPQHPLAGEVCQLLCEFTGHDRAALCNTGSEAVLGALRIARTVTGRHLVVAFTGSYHGINDEVIVRGSKQLASFPAAPGILPAAVRNMLILDYGTDESLRIIRERAPELAAVLVEPVQSRRPEFQPVDFLREVREITAAAGAVLIFDEVITGFRLHPGGAQALFGIRADLATYGKVIGGGLPIGAILGQRAYMDALDGGFWQYGDASYPEAGVTYFAGTFVRHPLALAAAKASLHYMRQQGPDLQNGLTLKAERLATTLNAEFVRRQLPLLITQFGSLWRLKSTADVPYGELLFVLLREKGIHIWDGFPCFVTAAYTEEDITRLIAAFVASADELIAAGFFPTGAGEFAVAGQLASARLNQSPAPGARLGRDPAGNPAWFVADAQQANTYAKIDLENK